MIDSLILPKAIKQWSLTSLREKLIKIDTEVVRHGRYVILQMAEVAMPKELFQEILQLIDGLRPRPAPECGLKRSDASITTPDRRIGHRSERQEHCLARLWLRGNSAVCAVPEFIWQMLAYTISAVYLVCATELFWCA